VIKDTIEKLKELIRGRKYAYGQVFNRQSSDVRLVLKDLARFCRAHETTYHQDPRLHAALEGRKEVWLRIQNHLELSEFELFELHKAKDATRGG
jgi:hypothetical protein